MIILEKVLSKGFTDEDMLDDLRMFYKENGRRPHMKDFKGKLPSCDMISKRFGSWLKAIELAGIPKGKLREGDYSKEELIEQIHNFVYKNSKAPTYREMRKQGYAGVHAFINHFGSFKNALIEADVFDLRKDQHQFCDTYTNEELLEHLKEYMKDKERIPIHATIKVELTEPSISTYERRFYSIFNALEMIGYSYSEQKEQDLIVMEDDMISKYKQLKEMLNRVPSSRDIDEYSKKGFGYAMKTYESHFGSLSELQILCGFIPTVVGRSKSRQDLIDDLIMMSNELGKTPSQLDVAYFDNVASSTTYTKEFGSWVNSIKEAGLKPLSKIYYSIKGTKCLSYYEFLFTNMLEEYNVKFEKEEMYSKYIETERRFRFDYVIYINNKKYFIEIFGMTDNKDYEKRMEHKKQLCKENGLPLIEIYPKDFTSYKLENIHKMLEQKVETLYN